MNVRSATKIDKYIAENLKRLRKDGGITQMELGKAVGVSFQQIQKYEKAINRISASRLFVFCDYIGCSITEFYYSEVASNGRKQNEDAL